MSVIDHGSWVPYKPETLPEGAPSNALFARRESDLVDWYEYVNSGENFVEANVKMMAYLREGIGHVVGPAVYDPTMLFPAGQIVIEVADYTGTNPQKDFGGKVYDPATMTFSDAPPPVPPPNPAMDEAVRANRRVDAGVQAAVDALPPETGLRGMTLPPGFWPACAVSSDAVQAIIKNTPTKINFDVVEFDVTSAFDVNNNRFQPDVAGYYQINCGCGVEAGVVQNYTSIYKNGVEYRRSTTSSEGGNTRLSTLVHLNGTTDYVEGFVRINSNFNTVPGGILTSFSAALVQPEATPYATQQHVNEVAAATQAMLIAQAELES